MSDVWFLNVLAALLWATGGCSPSDAVVASVANDTDAPDTDSVAGSLADFWQRSPSCTMTDPAGACASGGVSDFIYLEDGSIRELFSHAFSGYGTGGVGSALSTDGGKTFVQEPGLRIASSGQESTWDFQLDQVMVFRRSEGWGVLVQNLTETPHPPVTTGRLYLFTTTDGLTLTPVGPATGEGTAIADQFHYVGRGGVFRPAEGGELRAAFTCDLEGKVYGGTASDLCAMRSTDDGVTWTLDLDPSVRPWRSSDQGQTWTQDTSVAAGILIEDGNESYVFPLTGGGWGMAFSYNAPGPGGDWTAYGVFGTTSTDGIQWSAPVRLDMRHADGVTSCYHEDTNGDGAHTFAESSLNCESGDVAVLLRADGKLAIVAAFPGLGEVHYVAQP